MSIFFLLLIVSSSWASSWWPPTSDTSCSFTRDDSYQCLKTYVDVHPKNDEITQEEVDLALSTYLPTYLKPIFWFLNTNKIVNDCDYDKNGVITARDWLMAKETCLPKKENWCTMQWFCEIAENE